MKKSLLFGITMGIGFAAIAQNSTTFQVTPSPFKNKTVLKSTIQTFTGNETVPFSNVYNTTNKLNSNPTPTAFTNIGNTGYQLQTNRSVRNGFVKNTDNTLSGGWIFSVQTSAWSDR